MPKFETLDERCKFYEKLAMPEYFTPGLPILARIDGKSFHSFTKGLERPYDKGLSDLMIQTTKYLVAECNAAWGYVQSDEISLGWFSSDIDKQLFFDGKPQKIVSITASLATYYFNRMLSKYLPSKQDHRALFDSRVWVVPSPQEAAVYAKWRQKDATKNAITMAASSVYSHRELQGVHGEAKQEMLYQKGINFNDYPAAFRRGTFVRIVKANIPFTTKEIEKLPAKHAARRDPNLVVERNVLEVSNTHLTKIINPEGFMFRGEYPVNSVINNKESEAHV